MPLDDRHLRFVHSVVEWQGVRPAAEKLGVDPSVVSRTIASAEKSIGLTLFQRYGRTMKPTAAAYVLHDFFREMSLQRADLQTKLDDLQGLRTGSLSIGCSEGFVDGLFAGPLPLFRERYPGVRIELNTMSVEEIAERVAESTIDLGLAHNSAPRDGVIAMASRNWPIDLIVPAGHRLAGLHRPVTVEELLSEPLGIASSGYGLRRAVEVFEFTHRVQIRPAFTANGLAALRAFVAKGLGVMLLPRKAIRREIEAGLVVAVEIDDFVFRNAEAQLLVRKGRRLSPAATEMSRLIIDNFEQL